jgi:hypothetical protein
MENVPVLNQQYSELINQIEDNNNKKSCFKSSWERQIQWRKDRKRQTDQTFSVQTSSLSKLLKAAKAILEIIDTLASLDEFKVATDRSEGCSRDETDDIMEAIDVLPVDGAVEKDFKD